MKKSVIVLITIIHLFLFKINPLQAQINKGCMLVGFQFGGRDVTSKSEYNKTPNYNYETKSTNYRPALNFNYFYLDNLSVGMKLGYNYLFYNNEQSFSQSKSIGHEYPVTVNLTKYINITSKTNFYLSVFLSRKIGRNYGFYYENEREINYTKSTFTARSFGLDVGMLFNLSKRWAIKLDVNGIENHKSKSSPQDKSSTYTESGWNSFFDMPTIAIGVSFFIRKTVSKEESK